MNSIFWSSICFLDDLVAVKWYGLQSWSEKHAIYDFLRGLCYYSGTYKNYRKLRVIGGALSHGIAAAGTADRDQSWVAAWNGAL